MNREHYITGHIWMKKVHMTTANTQFLKAKRAQQ